jgi:hypothetical protein
MLLWDPGSKRGNAYSMGLPALTVIIALPAYALTQLQLALYGEELARQGLRKYVDILLREPAIKNSLYLAYLKERQLIFSIQLMKMNLKWEDRV